MKRQGQLVRWESARGFGFIRSPDISADVFVHLRDFLDRGVAPQVGMALRFEEIHVGGKGPRAVAVEAVGATPRRAELPSASRQPVSRTPRPDVPPRSDRRDTAPVRSTTLPFLVLAIGYAALVGYGVSMSRIPMMALGLPVLASLLTFFMYGFDKHAAETGRWRTQESTLHLLALIGGWPGAWWAQRLFRHKWRKARFMTVYWATVVMHIAAVGAWIGRLLPAGLLAL
jgi:uncharacterized membrane protein YsdA (DUF1294 family)/cold shock CspA family protein